MGGSVTVGSSYRRAATIDHVGEPAPPSLSGAIVLRNLDAFRAEVGPQSVARAIASLPDAQQAEIEALVPSSWIPVATVDAAYQAIATQAGRDLLELYPVVVRQGVANALRSVWKWLLRLTTDRALVSRTPIIYRRGHSVGELTTRIVAPGHAEVVLTGWSDIPPLRQLGVACGIRATLEVAGRRNVEVTHDPTPDGVAFTARWT